MVSEPGAVVVINGSSSEPQATSPKASAIPSVMTMKRLLRFSIGRWYPPSFNGMSRGSPSTSLA